jgi:ribosomal protein S18 acetylase RimI-like enzyme
MTSILCFSDIEDIEKYKEDLNSLFEDSFGDPYFWENLRRMSKYIQFSPQVYWLVVQDGKAIAFCLVERNYDSIGTSYLSGLCVNRKFRMKKIGSSLLNRVVSLETTLGNHVMLTVSNDIYDLTDKRYKKAERNFHNLIKFYKKYGFKIVSDDIEIHNCSHHIQLAYFSDSRCRFLIESRRDGFFQYDRERHHCPKCIYNKTNVKEESADQIKEFLESLLLCHYHLEGYYYSGDYDPSEDSYDEECDPQCDPQCDDSSD